MRAARPRGYTLIELVLALGVSMIVIAGALALATAQQRTFLGTSHDRVLQEASRVALGNITGALRNVGFGVDPALAFDLGPTTNVRIDRVYGGLAFKTVATKKGDGTICTGLCRDSTTGPDEIVFYSRDPIFGPHPLVAPANNTSTSLQVALVPNQKTLDLQKGQVLQVACLFGSMTWAYVTVGGPPVINGDGTATVPIASGGNDFPNQNNFLADSCFTNVAIMSGGKVAMTSTQNQYATEVFKVDRYHYYVQSFDAAGNAVAWNTPGSRPYLMLDKGLSDATGALTSAVATDVEDLQLSYVFLYDTAFPVVGAKPGIGLTNDDKGINLSPGPGNPAYSDPTTSATRQNHHPGNIGAVRVSLVVRSGIPDSTLTDPTIPASGNRTAVNGDSGYARLQVETTVRVPNLSTLAPYFPSYGAPAGVVGGQAVGQRQLNVGGG